MDKKKIKDGAKKAVCSVNGHYTPKTDHTKPGWGSGKCVTCGKTVKVFKK